MNAEQWERVKPLLDEAIALEAAERPSFLDRACNGNSELRREIESLLASHEQAGTAFLKKPAADLKAAVPPAPKRVGRRIGVYQILEEIGAGGMGEVYRAVRADGQFTKEVAVKLVRGGFDSRFVLERFRNERQILATLDHPNTARLLDGGTTEDGIPYLVMELIEGVRIDSYCDEHKLSITGRLQLFQQVGAAVQYAHQRLVIHRDLKPSNILVTKEGVPKLLDFGIAKILDPAGAAAETTLARPMTPEYASPEQIRGEPITTASDVYSLGVVLYQLLTGHSPYSGDTGNSHELARAICDTDPGKPSSVVLRPWTVRTGADITELSAEEISRPREGSPAKLRRRLAGDLDHIALMALRKEPQRRYASVEQFAEDIRRHLEALPITATKGSWSYRAGKFVTRHKAGAAATAAVLVALAVGIGLTVREARIARRQADIAGTQRARAEKRFNDVRQLSDSLIFEIHDALQNLPGATPARKLLLDRALDYLDSVSKDAAGDPDLERELAWGYQRLAVVQGNATESNLGDTAASLASDRKALALFEAVAKANPDNTIDQLNVAMMHRILSYSSLAEASGHSDLEQAMAITGHLLKKDPGNPKIRSERSIEYQNLALMRDAAGDRVHALEAYRKFYELRRDLLRTNPEYRKIRRSVGMSTVMLGYALARMGSRDEGLKTLEEGIGFFESVPKGDDEINVKRELAISRQKRGDILLMNGDTNAALKSYREARTSLAPMAKADPQNTMLQFDVAGMDYQEGRALAAAGRYDEARAKLQAAREVFEKLHALGRSADDSPHGPADIYIWLGDVSAAQSDFPHSVPYYQKAVAALETGAIPLMDDDTRCDLATSYMKLGNALARLGNLPAAAAAFQKALDTANPAAALEHQDVPALYVIAEAQAGLGNVVAARARRAPGSGHGQNLLAESRAWRQRSAETWRRIPNPSRFNPNGFLSDTCGASAK